MFNHTWNNEQYRKVHGLDVKPVPEPEEPAKPENPEQKGPM